MTNKDDLNHMLKMLDDIKQIIKNHYSPVDWSEFEPKYIEKSFKDLDQITKKLESIIVELSK